MTPKTFIVVLNWNGWEYTLECLESLLRCTCPNCRIVVVDNGSTDNSETRIREWAIGERTAPARFTHGDITAKPLPVISYARELAERGGSPDEEQRIANSSAPALVMIQTGANLGFAGGNNVGIRYACTRGAEYVLLLNNDAYFRSPETLSAMIDFMDRTPRAAACGGRLFYPDGSPQQSYGNFPAVLRILAYLFPVHRLLPEQWLKRVKRSNVIPDGSVREPVRIDWPSGACLMVRAKAMEEVGMLDEQYFLYVEETDWCFRMREKGWDRYYLPEAEVIHVFGGSIGNAPVSMQRYHLESQFTYYRKHFSARALSVVAAGYMVRSSFSVPYWKIAALVLSGARRSEALEHLNYWLFAFSLATATMRGLISGDRDVTGQSSTAVGPRPARNA